jgi:hypothetical protein
VIARRYRHPSQAHHTVMAGATWEQAEAATGGDPRRQYRRDLPVPRARRPEGRRHLARRPGLPGPPAPGRAPDHARRPGRPRRGDPAPPPVYGRATIGSSLWPSLTGGPAAACSPPPTCRPRRRRPDRQQPQPGTPSRRAGQHRQPDRQSANPQEADGLHHQPDAGERANIRSPATAASLRKPAGGPQARSAPTPTPPHATTTNESPGDRREPRVISTTPGT